MNSSEPASKKAKTDECIILKPNGAKMPTVGLGTWKATKDNEVGQAVKWACAAGYRHIDAAACYGNEHEVGAALKEVIDGGLPRDELFVTSKLWNSEHDPKDVKTALQQTLSDLQLTYVDLFLIHWPQCWEHEDGTNRSFPKNEDGSMKYTKTTLMETWAALEQCVDEGLTKAIGLSNFNSGQIQHIIDEGRIAPAVLQVEVHPFLANAALVDFAQSKGVAVTAYSPLGSGVEIDGERVIDNAKLKEIAGKYEKSAPQLVLAWLLARGIIVIPKSVKEERIQQNLDVRFVISDEDVAAINAIDKGARGGWGGPLVDGKPRDIVHPHYPFRFAEENSDCPEF